MAALRALLVLVAAAAASAGGTGHLQAGPHDVRGSLRGHHQPKSASNLRPAEDAAQLVESAADAEDEQPFVKSLFKMGGSFAKMAEFSLKVSSPLYSKRAINYFANLPQLPGYRRDADIKGTLLGNTVDELDNNYNSFKSDKGNIEAMLAQAGIGGKPASIIAHIMASCMNEPAEQITPEDAVKDIVEDITDRTLKPSLERILSGEKTVKQEIVDAFTVVDDFMTKVLQPKAKPEFVLSKWMVYGMPGKYEGIPGVALDPDIQRILENYKIPGGDDGPDSE